MTSSSADPIQFPGIPISFEGDPAIPEAPSDGYDKAIGEQVISPVNDPLRLGSHTLSARGLSVRYHVHGTGPICVAHPGGPGVHWSYLRMPILERQMTVVYLEPPGTGHSDNLTSHPHGYTRTLYSDVLGQLLDHLHVERVYLLGHSHGGFVVQRFALEHPDRLNGVILYESAAATGDEHGAEAGRQVAAFVKRNPDNPEVASAVAAFASVSLITGDVALTAALRRLFPVYVADYWAAEDRFRPLRKCIQATYISTSDAWGKPEVIDDRAELPNRSLPW